MSEFDDKLNAILGNPDSMAQIMQLAQSLSGGSGEASASTAATQTPPSPPPTQTEAPQGGIDTAALGRFLPLLQEMQSPQQSNASQLLLALRPYLRAEKQEKVARAIRIATLIRMGKRFFSEAED